MMNSGDYGLPYRWRARRRGLNGARAWTEGLRAGRAERLVAAARRELGRARAGWRALPGPPVAADGNHDERPAEGHVRSLLRSRRRRERAASGAWRQA